jgi:hypothetical protein
MIRECFKAKSGIMFLADGLRKIGLDPASLYPIVQERPAVLPIGDDARIEYIPNSKAQGRLQPVPVSPANPPQAPLMMTEEEHELRDALAPIYDQLSLKPFWWILEMIPIRQHVQQSDNTWERGYKSNMGSGRRIPKQKKGVVKVHRSVKMRMEAHYPDGKKYKPKASFEKAIGLANVVWVD